MKLLARSLIVILLVLAPGMNVSASSWLDLDITERDDGGYFSLETAAGDVITKTARILDLGDTYIDADNNRYRVSAIDEDTVTVEFVETVELPDVSDILGEEIRPVIGGSVPVQNGEGMDNNWTSIGIYQTHNAESYVPTSGVESKDEGDILQVGRTLAEALENQGFEVHWSDNSHLPHDGGAYSRSRRTVMELLETQPATLIDVHRDATPPEVYETQIEGQPATKVRIVVGRQNQNREATLEYAKRIKAVADEKFPGIIEGIFDARGNYNQDIGPRMILLEFGAHTNPMEQAQQAAEFFAEVIPAAAGLTSPGAAQGEDGQVGAAARRSIWWVLGLVAAISVGFVVLNKQGLGSLGSFFGREFGSNREEIRNKEDNQNDEDS